ncbi:hypothetical protein BDE02_01G032100 [Populus trichocarpa]|nr:hypothetical protein BDE02_01G032100 [Populus trichocarpa]
MANACMAMRNLLSLAQKRFFNTSVILPTASSSFTAEYLIKTCGLPLQPGLSVSKKLQIDENNLQNSQAVVEFLKSHHFKDAHIAKMVQKCPAVLRCKVEDNLEPKFDFFIKNGFEGQLLPQILMSDPRILVCRLDTRIKPCLELLKPFLGSNENIIAVLKRASWLLTYSFKSCVQPNIDFLIKEGLPLDKMAKLLMSYPRTILIKHDRMVSAANYLKNLGLEPKAPMFIHAFRVMVQLSEPTWKKKIEAWKSVGWSEGEILGTFKRFPFLLSCSEEKINCMMDFFVNTVKLGHQTITANPSIFKYSFDKRIYPRYNVLKVLESKKLIRVRKTATFLKISEEKFLENYITKYESKVPGLLEIYGSIRKTKGL